MFCGCFMILFMAGAYCSTIPREPPLITNFSRRDLVLPGEVGAKTGFYLPCQASGSAPVSYLWLHNGQRVAYGAQYSLVDGSSLRGQLLNHSNSGEYQCFARNEFGEAFSRKIQVIVTVAGKFSSDNDKIAPVTRGMPIEIPCPRHEPSFGAAYRWGQRDQLKPDTFRIFEENDRVAVTMDGTMVIMFVTRRDIDRINGMGGIQCEISTAEQSTYSHRVRFKRQGTDFIATLPPEMYFTPKATEEAREGLEKRLLCLAVGKPPPYILWEKDGKAIFDGKDGFELPAEQHNRLLIITKAQREKHVGNYTCTAISGFYPPASATTFLSVKVSPEWTVELPPKSLVEKRKNKTLTCLARGEPAPTYRWYRNARQIMYSNIRVTLEGNVLHLTNVAQWHEAVFQCVAENNQGMNVSSTWVHVLNKGPQSTVVPTDTARLSRLGVVWVIVPVLLGLVTLALVAFLIIYLWRRRQWRSDGRARVREERGNAVVQFMQSASVTRSEQGQSGLAGINQPPVSPHYESLDPRTMKNEFYEPLDFEQDLNGSSLYESLDFRSGSYQRPVCILPFLERLDTANENSERPVNQCYEPLKGKSMNDVEDTSLMSHEFYEPMRVQEPQGLEALNFAEEQAGPSPPEYYVPMGETSVDGPVQSTHKVPEDYVPVGETASNSPAPEYYVSMANNDPSVN